MVSRPGRRDLKGPDHATEPNVVALGGFGEVPGGQDISTAWLVIDYINVCLGCVSGGAVLPETVSPSVTVDSVMSETSA